MPSDLYKDYAGHHLSSVVDAYINLFAQEKLVLHNY